MKNFTSIITRMTQTPWLITEEALNNILNILERHAVGDDVEIEKFAMLFEDDAGPQSYMSIENGVGILNLEGPIFPKANMMTELSGASSLEMFRNDFRELLANNSVHSILLNVDSPGGVSDHVMEMGEEIFAARNIKPVVAVANTMAASAAYWIASQAGEFYITPSGLTGSLGVYTVHTDETESDKMRGVTKTVIQAGQAKAGHEQPLNEHSKANLQNMVDDCYSDFVSAIARSRNLSTEHVEENFGQGGVVTPRKALETGMVDGIESFDSLRSRMAKNGGVIGNSSAVAAMSALVNQGYVYTDSTNTDATWRFNINPTSTYPTVVFEPDLEHADPGTQGEPIPRESPMEGDPAVTGGWRVPSDAQPSFPPAEHQPPPKQKGARKGSAMDREALVALATTLGIVVTEEMEDAEIAAKITSEVNDVIVPLNDVQNQVDKRRSFATEFPDEYEKYQKLLERDELHEARLFAERWERFEIEENGARRKTTQGFAARTLSHIEDIHLKMARRQLTVDDVANLLDSIATAGTVDFSEKGSSRSPEETSVEGLSIKEVRQQFADEVARVMEEDSVDRKAAIKIVSGRNPELAEAYKTGHLRR